MITLLIVSRDIRISKNIVEKTLLIIIFNTTLHLYTIKKDSELFEEPLNWVLNEVCKMWTNDLFTFLPIYLLQYEYK